MAAGSKGKDKTLTVTFKVSQELFEKIQAWGEQQRDETGLPLTVHTSARRLMNFGISQHADFQTAKGNASKR